MRLLLLLRAFNKVLGRSREFSRYTSSRWDWLPGDCRFASASCRSSDLIRTHGLSPGVMSSRSSRALTTRVSFQRFGK